MSVLATLLNVVVVTSLAGPFSSYQEQNNSGLPMTVLSPAVREFHTEQSKDTGRGVIEFTNIRWSEERHMGLAQYTLTQPDHETNGWMVFGLNKAGLVATMSWTFSDPPAKPGYGAEMGQGADLATTAAGLSMGMTDLNPLMGAAAPVMAGLKLGLPAILKAHATHPTCTDMIDAMQDAGFGAAAWNVGALVGLGPVAIVPAALSYFTSSKSHKGFWRCVPDDIYPLGSALPGA